MRVWLYYRLSRDEDEELNSLMNQRSIIESYALNHGYTIVGESCDDNISGMHFDRDGIEQLTEAVDAGLIDAVIVKDLSRLDERLLCQGWQPPCNYRLPAEAESRHRHHASLWLLQR